jgi:hypothetical protein
LNIEIYFNQSIRMLFRVTGDGSGYRMKGSQTKPAGGRSEAGAAAILMLIETGDWMGGRTRGKPQRVTR